RPRRGSEDPLHHGREEPLPHQAERGGLPPPAAEVSDALALPLTDVALGWTMSPITSPDSPWRLRRGTSQQRSEAEPDDRVPQALAADDRTRGPAQGRAGAGVHRGPDRGPRAEHPGRVQGRPEFGEGHRGTRRLTVVSGSWLVVSGRQKALA